MFDEVPLLNSTRGRATDKAGTMVQPTERSIFVGNSVSKRNTEEEMKQCDIHWQIYMRRNEAVRNSLKNLHDKKLRSEKSIDKSTWEEMKQ